MPFFNHDLPEYHNRYWDPIWAACAEARLTVNFHGGNGLPEMGGYSFLGLFDLMTWPQRTLALLIFSGVFDRHPTLHATMTEARASWIPDALAKFDAMVDGARGPVTVENVLLAGDLSKLPQRRPSEYWADNWFAGASITNVEEMARRHEIGLETLLYGIDYPHPEGSWGQVNRWVSVAFSEAGVTEEEARKILGLNVARLYELDLEALAPAVERVGPLPEEVLSHVSEEDRRQLLEEARASGRDLGAASFDWSVAADEPGNEPVGHVAKGSG